MAKLKMQTLLMVWLVLLFKDLTPGDYIVNVNYDGDDACDGSTNSTSFNVAKADSDVVISVDDVVYGGDVTVVAAVSSGATGNVTFYCKWC